VCYLLFFLSILIFLVVLKVWLPQSVVDANAPTFEI